MNEQDSPYLNRELSWIEFNQRVLDEASDESNPLLERIKFLAITSSNLDEFFMVRVGGLHLLRARSPSRRDPSGLTAAQQLEAINVRMQRMVADQYSIHAQLEPRLAEHGIHRLSRGKLNTRQLKTLEDLFDHELFAVYTPQAVSSGEDFPVLSGRSLNVLIRLSAADSPEEPRFAIIPFGPFATRIITIPSEGGYSYTLLEDVVEMFAERFFPGLQVLECAPFRITRNADLAIEDEFSSDLLAEMKELLDARKVSDCVRLEIAASASQVTRDFLSEMLHLRQEDIYDCKGPLELQSLFFLADLRGFDELRYEQWPPLPSPEIDPQVKMFDVIAHKDVLLYHPYDSFEPVVRMMEEAAEDPDVLAIKQTLYRTSKNSPIVAALRRAAENGKHVTVILELKARFDEARNIEWAKDLERAAVQVLYGVRGFKTHSKVCIIVRREPHGIQRYVHFGTGNYNEQTARLYSDVSFLTNNEELGADAISFFNSITGFSQPQDFRKLEAAPLGMRDRFLEMIHIETRRKKQGQEAQIVAKVNSLVDPKIIDALYRASQTGVTVKLNVRGICCLRPGVPGLSDNIEVVSIIDRYLEHARVFYFYHGGDERIFISSADWMPRNLDRRIELMVPIEDTACRRRLLDILNTYFLDNVKARRLRPDGSFERVRAEGAKPLRSQEVLYQAAKAAVKQAEQFRLTTFEPHRPE